MPSRRKVRAGGASGSIGRGKRETAAGNTPTPPGGATAVGDKDRNALSGQAAHDYITALSEQWADSLNPAEIAAVKTWVGSGSFDATKGVYNFKTGTYDSIPGAESLPKWGSVGWSQLNKKLWTGAPLSADESTMFKTLQGALAKAPTIDKPIILNKQITLTQDQFNKQMVVGQTNVQLGVTNFATTFKGGYGAGTESISMKVYVPAGAKMAYISQPKVGNNMGETEVLAQSRQRIRVDSITKGSYGGYEATGTFIPGII